jgi:hypothetical protein
MSRADFVRSSHCHSSSCVEVCRGEETVLVRDGKDPDGPVLRFTLEEWRAFVLGVKADEFPA